MEVREQFSPAVLRVFGREPLMEDWRYVGRWAYGAAWLAEDRAMARDFVRVRLAGAAEAATLAAMAAGRGSTERFTLVSALARIPEAIHSNQGPYAPTVDRIIEEAAAQLVKDGQDLRGLTGRERTAFAPRFQVEGFDAAMHEVGPDRHVFFRDILSQVDEAITGSRGGCPALRAMRLFLQSTLTAESHESPAVFETAAKDNRGPVPTLGIWLTADMALLQRRATPFAAAWAAAARVSGDALSKALAGLSSGSMASNQVVEALGDDPWALVMALAMTSEPEHAAALLDCAVQAQVERRNRVDKEVSRWAAQAARVDEIEQRAAVPILASYEDREGFRECPPSANLDLFSVWHVIRTAEEARTALEDSVERSVGSELDRRKAAVKRAQQNLASVCTRNQIMVAEAQSDFEATLVLDREALVPKDGEGAQRGCMFGFGAGCSVMATYAAVGFVIGTGGLIGKIAPLVVAVAALPVGAAIMVQIAYALRRASAAAEVARRRASRTAEFERMKAETKKKMAAVLAEGRRLLDEAEASLATFERQIAPEGQAA